MRKLPTILLTTLAVALVMQDAAAQPPRGSQLAPDENSCVTCHGEADLWEGDTLRLFVPADGLAEDVHWQKGVNCHDCHGGDPSSFDVPVAHSTVVDEGAGVLPFRDPLSEVKKSCAVCHQERWEDMATGAHAHAGETGEDGTAAPLDCGKCHGEKVHDTRAVDDPQSPVHPSRLTHTCGSCHEGPLLELRKGVHAHAGEKNEDGSGQLMRCGACHGESVHAMLSVEDDRSPVFLDHQVLTCGGCHPEDLETYNKTVHGTGLYESGLLVTAVCADCHGAHGIYYAADQRSTLHATKVATTCGNCHRFIEERLQKSVHGRANGPGAATEQSAPGGKVKRTPSCTDCHQGHHLLRPEARPFRLQLVNLCGNCHPDLSSRYAMSLHGELTQLGYVPAAKCPDCHGAHDILPISDPRSRLAVGENRVATCRQCHPHAVKNFTHFDPHADHKDAGSYPLLYFVYHGIEVLLLFFFGFFVIHAFLWFLRSFIHRLQDGRHRTLVTEQYALVRFEPFHRIVYAILIVSFLGLMVTGLPLRFSSQDWARSFAQHLGGFGSTSVWHRFFAALAIFAFAAHLIWGAGRIVKLRREKTGWSTMLFGPDSPVPNLRDLQDLFGMARWFLGFGPRPVFERWTYWEKFDYWAMYLAAAIIGTSGLILWYPSLFSTVLPGGVLNVAKVVHAEMAIVVASFLFVFHFFDTHFRPEKFPMDLSALTGLVSEEHLRKHRPEYVERLRQAGKLDQIRRIAPSKNRLRLVLLAGLVVYSLGLCLLAAIVLANLGK